MHQLFDTLKKNFIFILAAVVIAASVGYIALSSPRNVLSVSNDAPVARALADVTNSRPSYSDICSPLDLEVGNLCRQTVQKAIQNPVKKVSVCRKFAWFSFLCHDEITAISVPTAICQSLTSSQSLSNKMGLTSQIVCEAKVVDVSGIGSAESPTPDTSKLSITASDSQKLLLPNFKGSLQIVGLGTNPIVSGPIFFGLFFSRNKPASYPSSRFTLSLGNSFLQVSGVVKSAMYVKGNTGKMSKVNFSGTTDTLSKDINCDFFISDRILNCSLKSNASGVIKDGAIQELPRVSFYPSAFASSLGDF